MQSNLGRVGLGVAVLVAAVVVLLVLKDEGGEDESAGGDPGAALEAPDRKAAGEAGAAPQEPEVPTIVVRNGAPVGGVAELTFRAGERIRFRVRSDTPDELHVHGYDVERELPAGRAVRIDFPATIEGIFEAELHESGEQVAEVRVIP